MTYQQFLDFIMVHLWKQGDQVVIDALDNLVKLADSELNATFKVEDRNTIKEATAIGNRVSLPEDFRSLVYISNPRYGGLTYDTQRLFSTHFAEWGPGIPSGSYTVSGGDLWFTGTITPEAGHNLVIAYYANLPDFKALDQSWVADKFFNVYLYCVLKHSAPFLREDERVQLWVGLFNEAFDNAMTENAHEVKYAGTPLRMRMRGIR